MWMVPTERMPLLADTVHYDTVGQQRRLVPQVTADNQQRIEPSDVDQRHAGQ